MNGKVYRRNRWWPYYLSEGKGETTRKFGQFNRFPGLDWNPVGLPPRYEAGMLTIGQDVQLTHQQAWRWKERFEYVLLTNRLLP
jgi:hypothetical protein